MIATYVRNASDSTDLKAILNEKVPKEQERVKNFRKQHGNTKVGEVTVDMVSPINQLCHTSQNGDPHSLWE